MKITERTPNFVDKKPSVNEFNTLEEFFKINWIRYWCNQIGFYKFDINMDKKLFSNFRNGDRFFMGYFEGDDMDLLKKITELEFKKD